MIERREFNAKGAKIFKMTVGKIECETMQTSSKSLRPLR